jgi:hypothetical protein
MSKEAQEVRLDGDNNDDSRSEWKRAPLRREVLMAADTPYL